jgi:hypothetical protein
MYIGNYARVDNFSCEREPYERECHARLLPLAGVEQAEGETSKWTVLSFEMRSSFRWIPPSGNTWMRTF